ncbi:MAG: S41 family peptidase [Spirochaetaceae bacterium]|nr:S41 family peptidase [Spirochaetaceae bacterium]MDT8298048.1 S41 family peptidase [Spirochaetaceae bacterium]
MDRKRERIIWIAATAALVLTLLVVLFSPIASAQTDRRRNTQDYIRDLEAALYVIQSNYVDEVDTEELFKGAMDGLFTNLNDPYSLYLDGEILEQMTDTTEGKYGGVGLYISKDRFDPENPFGRLPYVKVVSPIEDTPSWRAGINAGDYIYAIEGESAEGFSTQDVSDRLRGAPDTPVNVTILRNGSFTFDVVLVREEIEIPTVKTTVINGNTGYIRIIEFTPFTEPRVREGLEDFTAQGLDRLIIDVRSNPGGLLDSVVDVADLFFSGGVIVSTKYRQERQNQVHRAAPGKVVPSSTEIVVLIDRGSASASEILTGALKDRNRGKVIGETSFGKGSIQQMVPLNDAAIKLTTGRYYTPDGVSIDKTGIDPDIAVSEPELTDEQAASYAKLLQENRVGSFIDENPDPSRQDVDNFIRSLRADGLDPGERVIRLMVKRESERRQNIPPVVDLEFDSVLIRALDYLETGE